MSSLVTSGPGSESQAEAHNKPSLRVHPTWTTCPPQAALVFFSEHRSGPLGPYCIEQVQAPTKTYNKTTTKISKGVWVDGQKQGLSTVRPLCLTSPSSTLLCCDHPLTARLSTARRRVPRGSGMSLLLITLLPEPRTVLGTC